MRKIIVVADAKHAKFYESVGLQITKLFKKIEAEDFGIDHKVQELHTGFSGGYGSPSHFYDPPADHKDLDRQDFSRVVVKTFEEMYSDGKFEESIIVAPAKMLGAIREHFPKHLANIAIREIVKDLTHFSEKEIEKIIFLK